MKTDKKLVVYELEVTDWSMCIGGEHLSGKIRYDDDGEYKTVELERRIGLKEAKYLAEKNGLGGWAKPYNRTTNQFNTTEQLEKAAAKICKELSKNHENWLLIYENDYNPNIPISGGGKIVEVFPIMRKIAEEWEKVPNHKRTDDVIDAVYSEWKKLIESHKN